MIKNNEIVYLKDKELLSPDHIKTYFDSGFVIVKKLFTKEEVEKLKKYATTDIEPSQVMVKGDLSGNQTKLRMWNSQQNNLYGMFSRNSRLVDNVEAIFDEEVYVYSSKMILKNAKEGGAWEWHQDFGYWYNYGCLKPTMISCTLAIDAATRENGCLQVLRGSQKIGRINHDRVNEQTVVDPEMMEAAKKRFELEYIEMEPGDVLFFDGNILHRSDNNNSDFNRWSYIISYNTVSNRRFKKVREYGNYEKLEKVPTESVLAFTID